jgi:hypothetical protein
MATPVLVPVNWLIFNATLFNFFSQCAIPLFFCAFPLMRFVFHPPFRQNFPTSAMPAFKTLNVEANLPTVDEALRLLLAELRSAKAAGVLAVKIIHGYGSTGEGGALRSALRTSLLRRKKEGLVTPVIFGEKSRVFEDDARYALERCSELRHDRDLNRSNEGITIAILV